MGLRDASAFKNCLDIGNLSLLFWFSCLCDDTNDGGEDSHGGQEGGRALSQHACDESNDGKEGGARRICLLW